MKNSEEENMLEYARGNKFVYQMWKESYEAFNVSFSDFKHLFYSEYIAPIENKNISLQEKCFELKSEYKNNIEKYVSLYDKDKLLISLFNIKEYITKNMTNLNNKLLFMTEERGIINFLIYLVYNLEYQDKGGSLYDIEKGDPSYLADIFTYARCYSLLSANMERIEDVHEDKPISLTDMAFGTVETPSFHDYYDEFESLGLDEKIEDYNISDINIKMQIERLGISVSNIRHKSDKCIKELFGFHLDTLDYIQKRIAHIILKDIGEFLEYIENHDKVYNFNPVAKECLYEIADEQNIGHDELDSIIKNFSIDQKEEEGIELSCFYVNGDNVCFGVCDLMQTFNMFEKFALSGAHLQYYNNKDYNYMNLLHSSQKDMSKYLCFVMADVLLKNGYKLPTEVFSYKGSKYISPKVEIDNITFEKRNILKDLGDCDVLFLSEFSSNIICIEFKYFVPSVTYKELKKTDRNKITKQIYEKIPQIQNREKALRDNIPYLIDFFDGKPQDYSIKTIIVLARPNMYVFSDEIKDRIPYEFMTMNEFIRKVEKHYL